VRLVIVGDGVEREQLRNHPPSQTVTWLGRISQNEAATYLRGAIAALSITEDTTNHLTTGVAPLKFFEAMASGVPVIVSDLAFQADLVRTFDTGWVIPMADADALAVAVADLASKPDLGRQRGQNGAAYIRQYGSWTNRAEAIDAVITPIVNGSTRAAGHHA